MVGGGRAGHTANRAPHPATQPSRHRGGCAPDCRTPSHAAEYVAHTGGRYVRIEDGGPSGRGCRLGRPNRRRRALQVGAQPQSVGTLQRLPTGSQWACWEASTPDGQSHASTCVPLGAGAGLPPSSHPTRFDWGPSGADAHPRPGPRGGARAVVGTPPPTLFGRERWGRPAGTAPCLSVPSARPPRAATGKALRAGSVPRGGATANPPGGAWRNLDCHPVTVGGCAPRPSRGRGAGGGVSVELHTTVVPIVWERLGPRSHSAPTTDAARHGPRLTFMWSGTCIPIASSHRPSAGGFQCQQPAFGRRRRKREGCVSS